MTSHSHGVAVFNTQSQTIGLNKRAHRSGFSTLIAAASERISILNAFIFLTFDRL